MELVQRWKSNLLEVKNLVIHYDIFDGLVRALNGINFNVRGETLGHVVKQGQVKPQRH